VWRLRGWQGILFGGGYQPRKYKRRDARQGKLDADHLDTPSRNVPADRPLRNGLHGRTRTREYRDALFVNRGFFDHEDQLLDGVDAIRQIPTGIVQGRYDVVCPLVTAWDLHARWPEADVRVVSDAGHCAYEPVIASELLTATDRFLRTEGRS
jgi:pimeloyl-ACP methyl ester carboxylesterase